MKLNDWFEKGMQPDMYIESMQNHKENLLTIYDNFILPNDQAFFEKVRQKELRVIMLTEDWCGDAMLNIPILLKLAEAAEMDVRMLLRDQNLKLMDQYLTNGKSRSIPIFIFIHKNGNEVAKWGPRADKIQAFVDKANAKLPDKEAKDYQEKFKEMIYFMTQTFINNQSFWDEVYQSLKQSLQHTIQ
ncbi:thioredoxin family protein [Virgibacillus proomii]|uniref:thioredoxin family protein n=1 Tax=Virgibacillus proomii TaxID=84407 RepID=UPI000987C8F4|nr:thioredoxin family protein [Virgibacillus proomii]